jgi:BON domain-containing protein
MKQALVLAVVLGLAACSDGRKSTVSASQPIVTPPPQQAAASEALKPDPNLELAARVKRALEDSKLPGVDVTAAEGVVILWGTTATTGERSRAGKIATKVEGVKSVENRVAVVTGS